MVVANPDPTESRAVDVDLCLEGDALGRLRPVVRSLCVGLVDQPVRARLISSDPQVERLSLGSAQAIVCPRSRHGSTRKHVERMVDALGKPRPDLVHAFSHESYATAAELARQTQADLVLGVSSIKDCERLDPVLSDGPPHLIAFSEPIREALEHQLKIPADHIGLIRPGIIAGKPPERAEQAATTPALLCTLPLVKATHVDLLIRAVRRLHQSGTPASAFIVGSGPYEDALRKLTRQLRLQAHVTFAGLSSQTRRIMDGADFFVVPASLDYVSIAMLQALAAGVAVVAVPSPINDCLRPDETAFCLSTKPTVSALADLLGQLLADPERTRTVTRTGTAYVREHHTASRMAEQTAGVYRHLRGRYEPISTE